jgi:sulfur-oxidizing protein SoxZ
MADRKKMQFRARQEADGVLIQVVVYHPNETGQRTDPQTKQKIPAQFIKQLTLEHNGRVVATIDTSTALSADALMRFKLKNAKKGDKVKLSWVDSKGEKDSGETTLDL